MATPIPQPGARIPCRVCWLGRGIDYNRAWALQRRLVAQRADGQISDTLILLEHSHVYTMGRRSPPEHVLLDSAGLHAIRVPLVETDRGGEVTYHGPGQLVGYPIIDLRQFRLGPRQYVRELECLLVDTLADFDIRAHVEHGLTGVWVYRAKIAAIGVKIAGHVAHHGFALNVGPNLDYYNHIIPCGIVDRPVTSMSNLLGYSIPMDAVRRTVVRRFMARFHAAPQHFPPSTLSHPSPTTPQRPCTQ